MGSLSKKVFSSGVQAIATQVLSSIFFYIVSFYLTKSDFGIINWANAASMFITMILSFGLEQVIIRRIAASNRSDWAGMAYLVHAFIGSVIAFTILLVIGRHSIVNSNFHFLPWLFAAQAILYISSPFRIFLNAKEKFGPYGLIALISNIIKIVLVFVFLSGNKLNIEATIKILVICASFELLSLSVYAYYATDFITKFKLQAYKKLLKESVSQYISVIFDSSLSRMDWILLGLLASKEITADYSFAYRAYEITKLPLMIIAPVILPLFSRIISSITLDRDKQKTINHFFSVEMFFAVGIPMILNLVWSPLISAITNGKYGYSNAFPFFILSVCIPFQFAINLLWTISFAGKKYIPIRNITLLTAITNIVLNLMLIPVYGAMGAAIAYFISTAIQTYSYFRLLQKTSIIINLRPFFTLLIIALACYLFSIEITDSIIARAIIATACYVLLSVLSKAIKKENLIVLKLYLTK